MASFFSDIRLTYFASYLPETRVTNADIVKGMKLEVDETVLFRSVGSKEKRAAHRNETGSDMLARVGIKILDKAGLDVKSVDKLICSCDPVDQAAPDTAVVTQSKMGLTCPAFGVSMSCVGWICGVNIATGLLQNGDRRILVLAASTVGSKYFFNSPMHRAIFGDGAGGVLVERTKERGGRILSIDLLALGQFYKDIYAPMVWSNVPEEIPDKFRNSFYMANDNQIFFDALDRYIRPFFLKQLDVAGVKMTDVSLFVVHQASMPIFNHTVESFNIPRDKVPDYYAQYGNTIAAELPIITDHEMKKGAIKKGDIVYYLTYGAGFTAGAMIVKY